MERNEYFRDSLMKDGDVVTIKPINLNFKEHVSWWDNTKKKYVQEGHEMELGTGKVTADRYLKLTDEEKKRYTRQTRFIYTMMLEFNGETQHMNYPAKRSIHESLQECFKMAESFGQLPTTIWYDVTRNGTGLQTNWTVKKSDKKTTTQESGLGDLFEKSVKPKININIPKIEESESEPEIDEEQSLNETEQAIVEELSKEEHQSLTSDSRLMVFTDNGIETTRAKTIIGQHF